MRIWLNSKFNCRPFAVASRSGDLSPPRRLIKRSVLWFNYIICNILLNVLCKYVRGFRGRRGKRPMFGGWRHMGCSEEYVGSNFVIECGFWSMWKYYWWCLERVVNTICRNCEKELNFFMAIKGFLEIKGKSFLIFFL